MQVRGFDPDQRHFCRQADFTAQNLASFNQQWSRLGPQNSDFDPIHQQALQAERKQCQQATDNPRPAAGRRRLDLGIVPGFRFGRGGILSRRSVLRLNRDRRFDCSDFRLGKRLR